MLSFTEGEPMKIQRQTASPEQIARARAKYADNSDDNIEIDDDALVVPGGDSGCWIQSWVWLSEEDQEAEGEPMKMLPITGGILP
jgi:hypothetical protein